ncbi:MAG TPA: ATP-binding protein [Blastocatellia bacterium]|nr:ATP-binding protein [Blastocatellia bacterium]
MKSVTTESKARLGITIFLAALVLLIGLSLVLYLRAHAQLSKSAVLYLFSYQLIALVFGFGIIFLLIRWMLRPYRRIIAAARESPVRASSARSESEFVIETFQALVEQLQAKERELAHLHALERKRAERSERMSERLIANIPSGMVAIDGDGRITSVNAQAMKIFGAADTGALAAYAGDGGAGLMSVNADYTSFFRSSPAVAEMIRDCLETGRAFRRQEADVNLKTGGTRRLGLSIAPISDASQTVEGALCLVTDITEVIELRERMKLKEGLANLGEMAAGLAHEFKNSLATIHGFVQLLEAQLAQSNNNCRETLDATLTEVRLLARLVTDFLNFARPQQLSLARIDLKSLINECTSEVTPLMSESGIEMIMSGEFAEVLGDEMLLRRAFVNLMRNAIEAIDPQAQTKRIAVMADVDDDAERGYAHIRLSDTGGGIAPEDLHRIFIPFFTTKSRGYGVGLALVQKIFVAHGGDVSVEKSDGLGTIFHCRLPLSPRGSDMEQA